MSGLRNETDAIAILECPHGQMLKDCPEPQCRSDWDLLRRSPNTPNSPINPMVKKYEKLSDSRAYKDWKERERDPNDSKEECSSPRRSFLDKEAVSLGRYYRLLTEPQFKILRVIADLKEAAESGQKVRKITQFRIVKLTGLSRRTVKKELPNLRPFLTDGPTLKAKIEGLRIVRNRGERKRQFYLICSARLGERKQVWGELVAGKALSRLKRLGVPLEKEVLVPIPDRPMRKLLNDFWTALVSKQNKQTNSQDPDWKHNIEWARKRVSIKSESADTNPRDTIFTRLVRKLPLCRQCHTPILVGCRLDGERITRRKKYCSSACKMAARRNTIRRGRIKQRTK